MLNEMLEIKSGSLMRRDHRTLQFICAACLLIATNATAKDFCGMGQSEMNGVMEDGRKVSLILDGARVLGTPAWDFEREDVPLSVNAASKLAMEWAKKKYREYDAVNINVITIRSFSCGDKFLHWYYVFDFSTVEDGQRSHDVGNWLAVLMDGSIVEPEIKGK